MSQLPYDMLGSLADVPVGTPPPGIRPNFINPPSQGPALIALVSIFTSVMMITVGIRLAVNSRALHRLGWDDYTSLIAAVASITHSICILNSLKLGLGRHIWDVPATTLNNVDKIRQVTAVLIIYPIAAFFIKVSILLLYLRLFPASRLRRWGVKLGIVFMVAFSVFYFGTELYSFTQCTSASATEHSFCGHQTFYPIAIFQGSINVVTDFYILLLPIPAILKLATSNQRKIGLAIVFFTGLTACITVLIRLILTARTFNLPDKTWNSAIKAELSWVLSISFFTSIISNHLRYPHSESLNRIIELNLFLLLSCASTFASFISSLKEYWRPRPDDEIGYRYKQNGVREELEVGVGLEDVDLYHEFPETKGVSVSWRAMGEDGSEGLPGVGRPMGGGVGGMF